MNWDRTQSIKSRDVFCFRNYYIDVLNAKSLRKNCQFWIKEKEKKIRMK